jgi:hypothetical protein
MGAGPIEKGKDYLIRKELSYWRTPDRELLRKKMDAWERYSDKERKAEIRFIVENPHLTEERKENLYKLYDILPSEIREARRAIEEEELRQKEAWERYKREYHMYPEDKLPPPRGGSTRKKTTKKKTTKKKPAQKTKTRKKSPKKY